MFWITTVYQASSGVTVILFFILITFYLASFIIVSYCCTQ